MSLSEQFGLQYPLQASPCTFGFAVLVATWVFLKGN